MFSISSTQGGSSPLLDILDLMDDDALDAFNELLDLQVRLTGTPVFVLPRDRGTLH